MDETRKNRRGFPGNYRPLRCRVQTLRPLEKTVQPLVVAKGKLGGKGEELIVTEVGQLHSGLLERAPIFRADDANPRTAYQSRTDLLRFIRLKCEAVISDTEHDRAIQHTLDLRPIVHD